MKTLKNFLKFLLLDSALLMIVMTLTLYTYPSNIMAEDSNAPAFDSTNVLGMDEVTQNAMNNNNEEEQPEVYVPGEEFDDALTKANEDPASGGIVGMVEQFVGIAFAAAAISSLIFENTPRSLIDCPTNHNAKITLRLMQAAALVNLLGEVKAKSEFKKAAKLATDNTFAVKQKEAEKNDNSEASKEAREKNNKQLEAYDTLVKVYEHKVKGIETKKSMATIAELALLGALGTEVAMTMGHKGMCTTEQEANRAEQAAILTELNTALSGTVAGAATVTNSANCGPAVALVEALIATETSTETAQAGAEVAQTAKDEGESLLENTTFLAGMAAIVAIFALKGADASKKESKKREYSEYNPLKYSNEAYEISRVLWNNIFTPFPEALAEGEMQMVMMAGVAYMLLEGQIGKDTAEGTVNDTATTTALTTEETAWTTALGASACPTTVPPISALTAQNKASELLPIHCCGAKVTALTTNGYTTTIPNPSVMDTEVDIFIQPLPLVGSNTFEFVKPAILNMIEQTYYATHFQDLHKKDPAQALAELKAFHQVLDTLEENFEEEIKNSVEIKKFDREFALWEQDENFDYMAKLGELKLELVEDAHAMGFGELLGFGFKLFMAIKLLKGFLRNTALPKPRNRMWTFGAAAAINAVIISFTGKKLSDNKKQLEVVKAERDKFAKSSAIQTGVGEEEAFKNKQNLAATESNSGGSVIAANFSGGITATCATGSPTTGFSPSPCTNSDQGDITGLDAARRNRLFSENSSIPLSFRNLPATVSSAVNASANGSDFRNPKNFNDQLKFIGRNTPAIKKDLDKLVQKFDATLPKSITIPDGKTQNIPGLGATIATLKKTFGGTPIGGTEGILDGTELTGDKEKTLASANYKAYKPAKTPNFNFQKANVGSLNYGTFDDDSTSTYGVDDVIEGKAEENLSDFKVDAGDIIDKPEVSIFKIINVRYYKSYDILFDKKKTNIEEEKKE